MKHFVCIIMFFASLCAKAKDYLPILTEGKVWNCIAKPTLGRPYSVNYQLYVAEETVENGQVCRTIRYRDDSNEVAYTAFEDNGKLYNAHGDDGHPILYLDFNLEKGDLLYDNVYVSDVDYVEIGGVSRKRLSISSKDDNNSAFLTYWIEGIGTTYDFWATDIPHLIGENIYLESCYENGVCIFQNEEPPFWSDIKVTEIPHSTDSKIFDISGRIIKEKNYKEIVIQNGKKFIKK